MQYIWEVVLAAEKNGIREADLRYEVAEVRSPYLEVSFCDLNTQTVEQTVVEVNPFYRFFDIFSGVLDINQKEYKKTKEKAERTNDEEWIQKAAELELSYKEATDDFDKYENVLNSLREQWCAAANTENDKALADPETGLGATLGKIMTTIARMCAGDKVPYSDEKKVMEYDDKMYARAKQAQMIMASMKKKQKEYDSLWDKEGGEYDPEGVADNTEAQGELPDIPSSDGDSTDTGEAVSDSE